LHENNADNNVSIFRFFRLNITSRWVCLWLWLQCAESCAGANGDDGNVIKWWLRSQFWGEPLLRFTHCSYSY